MFIFYIFCMVYEQVNLLSTIKLVAHKRLAKYSRYEPSLSQVQEEFMPTLLLDMYIALSGHIVIIKAK